MAIWSVLTGLFSSKKAIEDVTETGKQLSLGIMSGLDHMKFGDQERAEFSMKGADIVLKYWDKVRDESSLQSQARRDLAILSLRSFFGMLFLAIICRIVAIPFEAFMGVAKFILEIALSGIVGGLVISIGTIYFGPHQLSKIVDFRKK